MRLFYNALLSGVNQNRRDGTPIVYIPKYTCVCELLHFSVFYYLKFSMHSLHSIISLKMISSSFESFLPQRSHLVSRHFSRNIQ